MCDVAMTIVYEQDDTGSFVATIADVPGAVSEGPTRQQARNNVLDALATVLLTDGPVR